MGDRERELERDRLNEVLHMGAKPCQTACTHGLHGRWTALGAANVLSRADDQLLEQLADALRRLERFESAENHVHLIEFKDDGWTIAHPIEERLELESLFACTFRWDGGDPGVRGRFYLDAPDVLGGPVATTEEASDG